MILKTAVSAAAKTRLSPAVCKESRPASPARDDLSLGRWIQLGGEERKWASGGGRGGMSHMRQPLEVLVIDLA